MRIELPDDIATALQSHAAAQGMSLQAWFKKLAAQEGHAAITRSPQEAAVRILELQKRVRPDPEGWTVRDYIHHGRP